MYEVDIEALLKLEPLGELTEAPIVHEVGKMLRNSTFRLPILELLPQP
jgi:hypothetical protein